MTIMKDKKNVLLLGGVIVDRYYEVEDYPRAGQNAVILDSFDKVGGCAINVAVTLKNLGMLPYIVSKIGDDENGCFIMHYIKSLALPTECITIETNRKTGYCLTILPKIGECTFFTSKACESEFPSIALSDELCKNAAFVYITGYYLLDKNTASSVLEFIKKIKSIGCRILFDPGPLVTHMSNSHLSAILSLSNLIIPNQYELDLIRNKLVLPSDLFQWLFNQSCQYIVIKKGTEGVEIHTSKENLKVGAFRVKCVDSSGAGDSFAGGLIYALSHGFEFCEAIEFASGCGAYTVAVEGPHGIFSIEDIYKIIKTQKANLQ